MTLPPLPLGEGWGEGTHLVLHAHSERTVCLLAIRHRRLLPFDFSALWAQRSSSCSGGAGLSAAPTAHGRGNVANRAWGGLIIIFCQIATVDAFLNM